MAFTLQNFNISGSFNVAGAGIPITYDPYFNYTTLLLTGNGTNNAQNNTFIDSSTNNITITRNGTPIQGSLNPYGKNWSLYTNGTSSYAYLPYSATRSIGTGDFSIECWINVVVQPANYTRIWSHQSNWGLAGSVGVELAFGTVDQLIQILIDGNSTTYYSATYAPSAPLPWKNKWVHIVGARQSGTLRIFVDGILREATAGATTNINGTSNTSFGTNSQLGGDLTETYISNYRMCIGSVPTLYQTSSTTAGTTIFTPPTTPLTLTSQGASGVQLLLFQDNRFIDNSPNNFAITTVSSPKIQKFGPFSNYVQTPTSYSGYFDGTGDYLSATGTALNLVSGDFTVEAWIYMTAGSTYQFIIGSSDNAAGYMMIGLNVPLSPTSTIAIGRSGINWPVQFGAGITFTSNTWTHVAITRSGTTNRAFINGVQLGSNVTDSTSWSFPSNTMWIGNQTGGTALNGYISNLRVVKGTAVYTTNFTPSTTPLTAISGTSLLTLQSTTFIDNSTNNFTITANGDSKPTIQNPFGQTTSENPLPYSVTSSDLYAGSTYFNGSTDYLSAPNNAAFALGTNNFCIEGWYYPTSNTVYQALVSKRPNFNATGSYVIYCTQNSNALKFYASSNNTSFNILNGGTIGTTVNNTWNHFAVYRIGNIFYGSLNGVVTNMGTSSSSFYADSNPLYIGGEQNSGTPGNVINGYLSGVRIVNGNSVYVSSSFTPPTAPLTAIANTSLLLNATNSGIYDSAMMNNLDTVGDSKISTTQSKFGSGSMYFDGTGDYLTCLGNPNLNLLGDFTIESYVYILSTAGEKTIFHNYDADAHGIGLSVNGAAPRMLAGNGTWYVVTDSTITISANTWNHIAYTRFGNIYTIWVNGVSGGTVTSANNPTYNTSTTYIGKLTSSINNYFNGYIDDLRITRGIARYTANFTPPGDLSLLAQ